MAHLASFFFLIHRLYEKKSAVGISLKTQELYLIVFLARYLDLFTNFHSVYNTCMKIFFIAASAWIIYLIRFKDPYRSSYEAQLDTFLHLKFAVLPCAVLALVFNEGSWSGGVGAYVFEIMWAFSEFLEALAIVPQLILLQRHKSVENITSWYVFTLGSYRMLYVANWVYRFIHEPHYRSWISWVAGSVQTLFFVDFFYYFALSKWSGHRHVILPT